MNILRKVVLDRANRKKDKSVSMTFITSTEQTSSEFMELDEQINQSGVLYFKPSGQLTEQELAAIEKTQIEVEGKSKAQRLRGVMYVYYQQLGAKGEFTDFYSEHMEKIIEQIKSRLD